MFIQDNDTEASRNYLNVSSKAGQVLKSTRKTLKNRNDVCALVGIVARLFVGGTAVYDISPSADK